MENKETGYPIKDYKVPVKRYCRTLDLRDDPELIAEYRRRHAKENIWKEVLDGIKEVGILEMDIYIRGTRLMMILEVPADLDLDAAMARLATLPRQQEWEDFMSVFQQSAPGASSAEKWQPMERVFHIYD
jgi:L-rhamnose mutarotase